MNPPLSLGREVVLKVVLLVVVEAVVVSTASVVLGLKLLILLPGLKRAGLKPAALAPEKFWKRCENAFATLKRRLGGKRLKLRIN